MLISGCLYLYTGFLFLRIRFDPFQTLQVIVNYNIWSHQNVYKIMLNSFFLVQYAFTYCQIPVHHQLYLQHLCSSCILGQSSSLKDVLTHPSSKRHSQEFASIPKVCRRLWWVMMPNLILTILAVLYFWFVVSSQDQHLAWCSHPHLVPQIWVLNSPGTYTFITS